MSEKNDRWDCIGEIEIDDSWRKNLDRKYEEYRAQFSLAQQRKFAGNFPLSIEVEGTYYCDLKCPMCPRVAGIGERESKHIKDEVWMKILNEAKENNLCSILLDHEAEAMMNPKFFEMVKQVQSVGIFDVWLHTSANMLTKKRSRELIESGLTKINFSIDAISETTYNKIRVGGSYKKVLKNIDDFLNLKKELKAEYLRVRVSFVEQFENCHEKEMFFDYWRRKEGVNMITFQNMIDFTGFETGDGDEDLNQDELDLKYGGEPLFHCSQPWEMPVITVDGDISPCGMPIRDRNKNFFLGNLAKGDTIASCWNGDKLKNLRALHDSGKWWRNNMCRVCVKSIRESNNSKKMKSVIPIVMD